MNQRQQPDESNNAALVNPGRPRASNEPRAVHPITKQAAGVARGRKLTPTPTRRPTATVASVTRKVDSSGSVSFAGASYRVGNAYKRRQVQVAVVGDTVEISIGNELIRSVSAGSVIGCACT